MPRLILPEQVILVSQSLVPNEPMRQLSLPLENINPGESFLIPIGVRFRIPVEIQRAMTSRRKDVVSQSNLTPLSFFIYADLSSDAAPSTRTTLELVLGRCDVLADLSPDVFWVGHGAEGIKVLKVKEDYPCRE